LNKKNLYEMIKLKSKAGTSQTFSNGISRFKHQDESSKLEEKLDVKNQDESNVLPFEFVALEACLEAVCNCLESEVNAISFPSLIYTFFLFSSYSFMSLHLY
jgi:ankyrin repeat protein